MTLGHNAAQGTSVSPQPRQAAQHQGWILEARHSCSSHESPSDVSTAGFSRKHSSHSFKQSLTYTRAPQSYPQVCQDKQFPGQSPGPGHQSHGAHKICSQLDTKHLLQVDLGSSILSRSPQGGHSHTQRDSSPFALGASLGRAGSQEQLQDTATRENSPSPSAQTPAGASTSFYRAQGGK